MEKLLDMANTAKLSEISSLINDIEGIIYSPKVSAGLPKKKF